MVTLSRPAPQAFRHSCFDDAQRLHRLLLGASGNHGRFSIAAFPGTHGARDVDGPGLGYHCRAEG
eukprot:CAMPEP_0181512548 /NCGR_PEP_ID=MMETSP1110-20121109/62029_1 /TAXON_ID=174948 /ORGANISM="Symbiodinium sp., Strain CCMP421" /LENGTH=64 /DNA_ID=CAMNT_0023642365 /DNA_START=232 /DNA_END=426 /DNA_ORIENTATION=-